MGIHKLPAVGQYWGSGELHNNIIKTIMPKNYFYLLTKALHFPEKEKTEDLEKEIGDNDPEVEENSYEESDKIIENIKVDPRHKIQLYLEKLSKNFQKYYVLGKNVTIDESLLHFNGKNTMKYYIPMKPHKWGFKIHLLCDSDTNYLYNMLFDPGKIGKDFIYYEDNSSLAESIVLRLLSCLNDKRQRNVFFDGWYSSISLMKKLTKMGYLNTTILRNNSKDLPQKIKQEGYDKAYADGVYIQKYEGKKTILFATNYNIDKEELRNIYNIKNRGVDTFDHYLEISSIQRRSNKWYKKILVFGIDASIINAKIIYELRTGNNVTTVKFKEKIVAQIFKKYKCSKHKDIKNYTSSSRKANIPYKFKVHNIGNAKNNKRKCAKCQQATTYICTECNISLHPECFIEYHNKFVFNQKPKPETPID
jgi:hypothetical protein